MLKCRASQLGSFLIASFLTACTPRAMLNASLDDYKRGYYRGSYYIVQQGDTLDYIAYVTDRDILDIINANHLTNPDRIYPGQKLNLWRKRYTAPAFGHKQKPNNLKTRSQNTSNSASEYSHPQQHRSENNVSKPRNNKGRVAYENSDEYSDKLNKSNACVNAFGKRLQKCLQNLTWQWPTSGRVISTFSNQEYGNKGIDITGQRGQSIAASADGKVVYAGSALRGYGNLIIIKHNKNYLSAYAHNESLLVREHQIVQKGQKIATMGSSGTDSVRLHFEIRYKGNSVNPNEFLPKI